MTVVDEVRLMWSYPFMVSAFRAATVVAVVAALVGTVMVLRRSSFAGHTLSLAGYPGATAAAWLGLPVAAGYLGSAVAASAVLAATGRRGRGDGAPEPAAVGTVQALLLATGFWFATLTPGLTSGSVALLFGSVLGVTPHQVVLLAALGAVVLVVLGALARPLLFASVDRDVAAAHGVPVRALDVAFLLLLGVTTAAVAQVTGALLVFTLLVLPPATARVITAAPWRAAAVAVLLALVECWTALTAAFVTDAPLGFWLATVSFAGYLLAVAAVRRRR